MGKNNYFIFGLKGAISIFPVISRTGKTFNMNLTIKTIIAYFQLSKINEMPIIHPIYIKIPTHGGSIGSSIGRFPARFACIMRMSKVVIDDVKKYITVIAMIIGELIGVLNSSIMDEKNYFLMV